MMVAYYLLLLTLGDFDLDPCSPIQIGDLGILQKHIITKGEMDYLKNGMVEFGAILLMVEKPLGLDKTL